MINKIADTEMPLDECEEILRRLVRVNSVNPPGNELDVIKEILSMIETEGLEHQIIQHGHNRGSLVITLPGNDRTKALAFVGHVDTVPVEDSELWLYPPFDGEMHEGLMYGRGTSDMKGGVVSMLMTLKYLQHNEITPAQDVKFCFSADEEYLGTGAIAMKENGVFDNVDSLVIPEPSKAEIGVVEKGALWLRLSAEGKSSHSSKPHLGINAIDYLMECIERLRHAMNYEARSSYIGRNTFVVTQFQGGVSTNVLPTYAEATLDIRTLPGFSTDEFLEEARSLMKMMESKEPGLGLKLEVINKREAVECKEDHPFVKRIESAMKVSGLEPNLRGLFFYTDASQIAYDTNIPFVILGPGNDELAHQRDEYISIEAVARMAEVYTRYVLYYLEEK